MKVCVVQPDLTGRSELERIVLLEEKLYNHTDADLVVLPELWTVGFNNFSDYLDSAGTLNDSDAIRMLAGFAKSTSTNVFGGSFVEKDGDNYYNTSVFFNRNGQITAKYRKIHLFGYESQESQILTPGSQVSVFNTDFGRVGMCTCYDLRFPEQFRKMLDLGAEVFIVGADWPGERLDAWSLFLRTRALENQSFLIAANCAGGTSAGHSSVISPEGEVVFEAPASQSITEVEIDISEVKKYRRAFPAVNDRVILT